ncbi:GNAT family N-acetyltransferase [Epibacterium sp. Ofav1-8]|uniref:GNAT family N-acetyltransferase n=1 Tax=Epibacterium sp. Ofav1-8 TaxID=2917735 RepID=UPI001EF688A6|nr:GNAT family N-acetyltransferase [Epibacterium sp. Ofav1-8]MCG7624566.1 acetyltransferase [Epibacterium sp. Ofav1-8]
MTTPTPIDFLRLTHSDHHLVRHIEVAPEQIVYCGTVDMAFASTEKRLNLYAIRAAGAPVGFFKIDLKYPETYGFARAGDLGLRAFMIDHRHQGRGIATAALAALPGMLHRLYPAATAVVLTVNIRNQIAVRSYRRAGFVDTGEIHEGGLAGPQHVMRLDLPDS